jgi:lipoprotein signal peptidase
MKEFISRQKILMISLVLMIVDFIAKTWIFKNMQLGQGINIIDSLLGIYRVETHGFSFSFYFRLILLLCFLFFLIRISKTETIGIFKVSIAFTFFGLIGDFFDIIAFGFFGGATDFKLGASFNGLISFRYIEYLYINFGFIRLTSSLSSLMANIGLIAFTVAIILRFKDFKKIIRIKR